MTFDQLKLTRQYLNAIEDLGYQEATEIQVAVIPKVMAGQDVIGIAQTGTGKTAAYILPILQMLKFHQPEGPRCLVLVPTKELVIQVGKTVEDLSKYTDLKKVDLYGGVGPKAQIEKLKEGVDIIIATPGRFLEVYAKREIFPKKIKHIVLDECDRMMDMGFWPQLREIQEKIPQKKQQLLFSATFPEKVERIADNFLLFPQRVEVSPPATPATTVSQFVYEIPNFKAKLNMLLFMLKSDESMSRVIVFVKTKEQATAIAKFLERTELGEVRLLHSNKGQNARINAIEDFKGGDVRVLVSTDVSARGIDVIEVTHVVNFNIPTNYEDYVHRIGRTGRAFKTGTAISFADFSEEYHINKIQKLIKQTIERVPLPSQVAIDETPFDEFQDQMREIDRQKRLENPDFKGAFHEKKHKPGLQKGKSGKANHSNKKNDRKRKKN